MALKKATKRDARLRFALIGPAGSGKTRTALELASRLGKRVAVIDSERGRSRAYADLFDFDVEDELPDFSPASYTKAIKEVEAAGYDVIVVDSGSHEWAGNGGVLGIVDKVGSRNGGNKFAAWSVGTPAHQSFLDTLLQSRCHLVITFRAKTEWVLEQGANGKMAPRAVGMGAVAREGTEYEVDFAGLLDLDHNMTIVKTTNYAELEGMRFTKPGKDLADLMLKWLSENTNPSPASAPASPVATSRAAVPATGEEVTNGAADLARGETAPATGASPEVTAERTAEPTASPVVSTFRFEIEGARTVAAMDAISSAIGAAHKAKAITDEERKGLIAPYLEKRKVLEAVEADKAASATQATAAA